jgi:hypothetical protein
VNGALPLTTDTVTLEDNAGQVTAELVTIKSVGGFSGSKTKELVTKVHPFASLIVI